MRFNKRLIALSAALLMFTSGVVVGHSKTHSSQTEWNDQQQRTLASLTLATLADVPRDQSNRVADSKEAITLGKALFFEKKLSKNGDMSCATCHQPNHYFTDSSEKLNNRQTLRVAPTLVGSAYNNWFYWDGRRDSLWAQALLPIETPNEMGSSRIAALRLIDSDPRYRESYQSLFPEDVSALSLAQTLPLTANPYGEQSERKLWSKIFRKKKRIINQGFANIGKAIAAFERTLLPEPSQVDRYINAIIKGQAPSPQDQLSEAEQKGLALFIDPKKTQCMECHNGPLLTNNGFHNIGTGKFTGENRDFGRIYGKIAAQMDPFNCLGNYSDAKPEDCNALRFLSNDKHAAVAGQFKVPTLRGLSKTAPYFHDGSKETLRDVVVHYHNISLGQSTESELRAMPLSQEEIDHLVEFLKLL